MVKTNRKQINDSNGLLSLAIKNWRFCYSNSEFKTGQVEIFSELLCFEANLIIYQDHTLDFHHPGIVYFDQLVCAAQT